MGPDIGEVGTIEMVLPTPPRMAVLVGRSVSNTPSLPPLKCRWACYGKRKPTRTISNPLIRSLNS